MRAKLARHMHSSKERTMSAMTQQQLHFAKDEGVADLWWPYGPAVGRYTLKTTAAETQGSLVQMLVRESRGAAVPLHVHYDVDETFYVIEGSVTAFVGDERIDAQAGDFVLGPRGVPHSWVVTSEAAELLVSCGPAGKGGVSGAGIEGFFREVATPVGEDKPEPAMPDNAHFAERMLHYGIELLGPPPAL
jgi:mannose-6-phosphate isomerase-like protein (cupin superfamily)